MVEVENADEIVFTRAGETLEDAGKIIISQQGDKHFLEICDVESEDEGEYTVICENNYGHVTSTAQLLELVCTVNELYSQRSYERFCSM